MQAAGHHFDREPLTATLSGALAGLSKAWGLPGLRIGWLATHDATVLQRVLELKDYTTM